VTNTIYKIQKINIYQCFDFYLFSDTTRDSYYVKGDDCGGRKRSKERITVGLCASMTGEKMTPLVIGKANKPRCFKKIKPETSTIPC